MNRTGKLKSSSSELDLDRPNIEDYLPSGSSVQHERQGKLRLCDLIDISPSLSEAAGAIVDLRLRELVQGANNNPLLIFPEGTCVNNHYIVMFMVHLNLAVCPVAIKYNQIFVDAFWNSRQQSFTTHLLQLMTSWAVVCDVWVRDIISHRAGLKKAPWDGYLKYSRPCPKHRESKFLISQVFVAKVL
ncbi:hypothetical protein PHAVU_002G192600 [Phaseolus vulgaris]|uniref:Phospholipid/glycerol acyltransferase domain-containing protein n=1 Tax=Phaseolus vulgaris TaxID=3885 RepID=V7CPP4_PHAVU|nr:hypothetical protein PHAVU_002G192600g [Phaseolus vulgaris]ESW30911.1 hypothetical protein PHAVU_002G192600g [Phaseolus vulgaris]